MSAKVLNLTDTNNFNKYIVYDLDIDKTKYEFSIYDKQKRLNSFSFFDKKNWKDYIEQLEDDEKRITVVGNVLLHQKRYKKITNTYTEQDKLKDKKYGLLEISYSKGYIEKHNPENTSAPFDLLESKQTNKNLFVKTIGYAHVGNDQYIRLVKHTILPLFIFLLFIFVLIGGMVLGYAAFMNQPTNSNPFQIVRNNTVSDFDNTQPIQNNDNSPLCYFLPFDETTTLTKDNKTIKLVNLSQNKGNYYISYEIYIDGNPIIDNSTGLSYETGAIEPGYQVEYDLWSVLDDGKYDLVCKAKEYDYNSHEEKLITYSLSTKLVITK